MGHMPGRKKAGGKDKSDEEHKDEQRLTWSRSSTNNASRACKIRHSSLSRCDSSAVMSGSFKMLSRTLDKAESTTDPIAV
jgi:hypothetical protein